MMMNTGGGMNIVKFDYKLMLLWHLNQISKISSRYFERQLGDVMVDPDKEYKRSVITMRSFLTPYLDNDYRQAEAPFKKKGFGNLDFVDWAELLGELMCLLERKQWLMQEDVTAEDEDPDDDAEEDVGADE